MPFKHCKRAEGAGLLYRYGELIADTGGIYKVHPCGTCQEPHPGRPALLPIAPAFCCGKGLAHKFQMRGGIQRAIGVDMETVCPDGGAGAAGGSMNFQEVFDQTHRRPMGNQVGCRYGQVGGSAPLGFGHSEDPIEPG
jgi:hypothetical protein